ncbi:MAG: FemAB family XrtA/PEP-CTERM system-associated protein [Planctomycetota bacterium]
MPETQPTPTLQITRASAADFEELDAWTLASPQSYFWHRPAWMRAVCKVFGTPDYTLIARAGGRIAGVLPMAECETLTLRHNLVSVPYGVYGGPAGDTNEIEIALVEEAKKIAKHEGVGCIELRQRSQRVGGLAESDLYVTFERDLPAKPEDALLMLPRKARAAARQGRDKFKLTFDEGLWFLDDFYRLFSQNKRHLGSPPLPREFFDILCEELKGNVFLHIVRHEVKPVAGVLSFSFRDTLLPYYSGGLAAYEPMQCNNFLYWKLMEWGVERGFKRFDFGRSRLESGPYHFKKNQGFEPERLHYAFHLVKSRRVPKFNPSNPAFDLPRKVWQRLPLPVHEWMGKHLSRYLT